jgi:hypothetical protein
MLVLGTIDGGFYKLFLVAHILCAIVGFGAVFLNGVYAAQMRKHPGPGSIAIFEANFKVSEIGQYFIYGVFLFGLGLVGLSDHVWKFSQTWVWLATILFIVGLGLSHGVLLPAVKRMGVLMKGMAAAGPAAAAVEGAPPAMPPQLGEMMGLGKRVAVTGLSLDILVVVILAIMVWKPGL